MKKLFWCGVGVAVAAASCVYLASRHVEHTPFPLVGQALVALGGEESSASGTGDGTEVIPGLEEPTPVEPPADGGTAGVVAVDGGQPGHIYIEELPPVPRTESTTANVETVPQSEMPTLPVMPYCQDELVSGGPRMPYADEVEAGESGEEESEPMGDIWMLLRRVAAEANAAAAAEQTPVAPLEEEQEMIDEQASGHQCPEDIEYHKTHQTCTYTGRSYPLPKIGPPAPEMPEEKVNNKSKPTYHESQKPIGEDEGEEEQDLPHYKIDTMEFRPSDAGFEHFVPGPF